VWGGERRVQGFCGENPRERDHWVDPDVDGKIILRLIFRKWDQEAWTGSIWLRDRERSRELVNAVMNFRVP
jgi:hypothetical protein